MKLGPMRTLADLDPMHPKWNPDAPRIYVESAGCSIQWLADRHAYDTVLEYNRWLGKPGLPEQVEDLEITRHLALMSPDHNQILKINEEMYKGTIAVAEALMVSRNLGPDAVFGWDFQRREPMVIVYPCSDSRRKLTPLPASAIE